MTVFHPYRMLTALCKKESANESMAEAGEVGAEVDDGTRYWGTGEGQPELSDDALQLAWWGIPLFLLFILCPQTVLKTTRRSIINDTYRSDLRLFYPTHLLVTTALYLTSFHTPPRGLSYRNHPRTSPTTRTHRFLSQA